MKESEQKGDMEVQSILGVKLWNKREDQKDSNLVVGIMVPNGTLVWSSSTARASRVSRVIVDLLTKATWNLGSVIPENKP